MLHLKTFIFSAKAGFFKALSDETRISIVDALQKNKWMNVGEICEEIGKEQSIVSHHLSCLRNCGLVKTKKEGKYTLYSLNGDIISEILDLTEKHVNALFENILSCEVIKKER